MTGKTGNYPPACLPRGKTLSVLAGTERKLENEGEFDQSDSLVYLPQDREAGFVLLCTGKPCSDLRIRTHQAKQMREFRKQKKLPAPYSWSAE